MVISTSSELLKYTACNLRTIGNEIIYKLTRVFDVIFSYVEYQYSTASKI